jgi:hypothetical protein
VIPTGIRRRFAALAGLLEIADREFQAIQDEDERLTVEARSRVNEGQLGGVEITPDAVRAFLDKNLGSDYRIAGYSYEWTARLLKRLGFTTLQQVEECIRGYDDDELSRIARGGRQGQTTRFEHMLLAGMGEKYIERHVFTKFPWFPEPQRKLLTRFADKGIEIGAYDPLETARPSDSPD